VNYDNSNSGALFVNDDKRPDKKDPDRTGSAEIVCVHCEETTKFWVNGWLGKSKKDDRPYLSMRFKAKDGQQKSDSKAKPAPAPEFNDDIPF
jgi:hypothetical protein